MGESVLKRGFLLAMVMSLAACGGVDPDSPLGKRTAIFKQMLNVSEDLGGMLRGRIPYDEQLFVEKAMELDALSQQPWQHFPTAKDDDDSSARDEVWQRQERFQELARAFGRNDRTFSGQHDRATIESKCLACPHAGSGRWL